MKQTQITMAQQTAMMQLLAQLKDERRNLPLNVEWDRCYQAIEMVIENTYLQMEKEQIGQAYMAGLIDGMNSSPKEYYTETYLNK